MYTILSFTDIIFASIDNKHIQSKKYHKQHKPNADLNDIYNNNRIFLAAFDPLQSLFALNQITTEISDNYMMMHKNKVKNRIIIIKGLYIPFEPNLIQKEWKTIPVKLSYFHHIPIPLIYKSNTSNLGQSTHNKFAQLLHKLSNNSIQSFHIGLLSVWPKAVIKIVIYSPITIIIKNSLDDDKIASNGITTSICTSTSSMKIYKSSSISASNNIGTSSSKPASNNIAASCKTVTIKPCVLELPTNNFSLDTNDDIIVCHTGIITTESLRNIDDHYSIIWFIICKLFAVQGILHKLLGICNYHYHYGKNSAGNNKKTSSNNNKNYMNDSSSCKNYMNDLSSLQLEFTHLDENKSDITQSLFTKYKKCVVWLKKIDELSVIKQKTHLVVIWKSMIQELSTEITNLLNSEEQSSPTTSIWYSIRLNIIQWQERFTMFPPITDCTKILKTINMKQKLTKFISKDCVFAWRCIKFPKYMYPTILCEYDLFLSQQALYLFNDKLQSPNEEFHIVSLEEYSLARFDIIQDIYGHFSTVQAIFLNNNTPIVTAIQHNTGELTCLIQDDICKVIKGSGRTCANEKCSKRLPKKSLRCSGCFLVAYCSRKCAKIGWKYNHRYICSKIEEKFGDITKIWA